VGTEKEVVARHEAGHALVASCISQLLPTLASEVDKLSIRPRRCVSVCAAGGCVRRKRKAGFWLTMRGMQDV